MSIDALQGLGCRLAVEFRVKVRLRAYYRILCIIVNKRHAEERHLMAAESANFVKSLIYRCSLNCTMLGELAPAEALTALECSSDKTVRE